MYRDALRLDAFSEVAGLRAAVHCNVAACALVLDRSGEAVDACTKALRLRPDYLRARLRRARARARARPATSGTRVGDFDRYLRGARSARAAEKDIADAERERAAAKQAIETQKNERRKADARRRRPQSAAAAAAAAATTRLRAAAAAAAPVALRRRPRPREAAALLHRRASRAASYHDVLGVGRDARPAAIKAYAKLALRFHPDRVHVAGRASTRPTAAMARINEWAYEHGIPTPLCCRRRRGTGAATDARAIPGGRGE